jgi:predicted nucleotidyltransferase
MVLTPRLDRPINQITRSVIREVKNAVTGLGLDVFLVGATARIILLENVFGLHTGRVTHDIDFAFAIESWDQFQAIKDWSTGLLLTSSHLAGLKAAETPLPGPPR